MAFFASLDHDFGTRRGVRFRIVVLERDLQFQGDIRKLCRENLPRGSCDFHGAQKRRTGILVSRRFTTCFEHRPVERRVVSRQKVYVFELLSKVWPDLAETGLILHMIPGDSMDKGENKIS